MSTGAIGGKFVDLAALSLSGSLVPSVPTQIMLKYNPPKMTIVYHFEQRSNDQYYHDILFERGMLQSKSAEDVVSHLYVTEAYYFNPKQIKRPQLLNLVQLLQQNLEPESLETGESRRKNFFERKRLLNYEAPAVQPSGQKTGQANLEQY